MGIMGSTVVPELSSAPTVADTSIEISGADADEGITSCSCAGCSLRKQNNKGLTNVVLIMKDYFFKITYSTIKSGGVVGSRSFFFFFFSTPTLVVVVVLSGD